MATSQIETVSSGADKAKLAAAVVLVIGSVAAFYLLSKQGAIAQWGVLLLGLVAATGVFLISESGRRLVAFGRDAWREVKSSLAYAQRNHANDGLCVRLCGGHGAVSLAD